MSYGIKLSITITLKLNNEVSASAACSLGLLLVSDHTLNEWINNIMSNVIYFVRNWWHIVCETLYNLLTSTFSIKSGISTAIQGPKPRAIAWAMPAINSIIKFVKIRQTLTCQILEHFCPTEAWSGLLGKSSLPCTSKKKELDRGMPSHVETFLTLAVLPSNSGKAISGLVIG